MWHPFGMFFRLNHLVLLALSVSPHAAVADETSWIVTEEQARCLIEHREGYLAQGSSVVLIRIESCPDTSAFAGALDGKQNYGGVSKVPTSPVSGGFDHLITYMPSDLECLDASDVRIEDGVAFLPKTVECPD